MSNVVNLFEGDKRAESLYVELESAVFDRAEGMPIPTILGVIDLLHAKFLRDSMDV